jgi:hypothetical protein
MKLSNAYCGAKFYAFIYHIQKGSMEVEFVDTKFFTSERKAWKWFDKKHSNDKYIELELVMVSGLDSLPFNSERQEGKSMSEYAKLWQEVSNIRLVLQEYIPGSNASSLSEAKKYRDALVKKIDHLLARWDQLENQIKEIKED